MTRLLGAAVAVVSLLFTAAPAVSDTHDYAGTTSATWMSESQLPTYEVSGEGNWPLCGVLSPLCDLALPPLPLPLPLPDGEGNWP